jgi:hypothetical protein
VHAQSIFTLMVLPALGFERPDESYGTTTAEPGKASPPIRDRTPPPNALAKQQPSLAKKIQ